VDSLNRKKFLTGFLEKPEKGRKDPRPDAAGSSRAEGETREVSVQRLAEARGIQLWRCGKDLIGLCPFHKDTNPSLNIDPVQNGWHCKGACGEGGDVIEGVMRAEGISSRHAVELLTTYLPPPAPRNRHRSRARYHTAEVTLASTKASR
jgi:hypothetical protein